jgi:hypothetical protein
MSINFVDAKRRYRRTRKGWKNVAERMERVFALAVAGEMQNGILAAEKAHRASGGRIFLGPTAISQCFWTTPIVYESDEHTLTFRSVDPDEAQAIGHTFASEQIALAQKELARRYSVFDIWRSEVQKRAESDGTTILPEGEKYSVVRVHLELSVRLVDTYGISVPYMPQAFGDYLEGLLLGTCKREDDEYLVQLRSVLVNKNGYCVAGDEAFDDFEKRLNAARISV